MGVPTRLGRYVVRRRLGSGGFATVWLAHDEQLDAEVAIKVLADNWAHDESVRHRFLEEGRFLRRVESEHVVQVHDVGELEDGRPFLVLTYADRGTLADRLKKEPLPIEPAVGVIVQVGRGLQALHRRGLLHRDVKPANVLFRSTDEGERAVLSDLGLGKSLDEVSRITMPGGTPSYVAPEQAMGERLDQRADQYSLGAVAYAALTGRSPHQVDGLGAAGRVNAPPPPSSLGFDIPDKIDAAIVRALDPDREKRWPDVESFARELVGALDETTHNFLPPAGMTVSLAAVETPVGEQTALSDSNLPTLVKNPGDGPTEPATTLPGDQTAGADATAATETAETDLVGVAGAAHAAGGAAGGAAASAGSTGGGAGATSVAGVAETAGVTETAGAGGAGKPRRKRGRWVVAALLALLLGGGAGFAVQRFLLPATVVDVKAGNFSVRMPKEWAQAVAQSPWKPPGQKDEWPALRASGDDNWAFTPETGTPG
ncbi:MAG TPA: serine/threonine-protein kinase, partial [Streptomyces sp.]|nr:serine/threonine-protein kinase [Streptomyces sp.]